MSIRVNNGGAWTSVPEEADRIFVNNGGAWADAKEVYVAEETTPGNYTWTQAWAVPTPPAGVAVTVSQEFFSGGDVFADFTHAVGGSTYPTNVEWEVDSVSQGTTSEVAGPAQHQISDLPWTPSNGESIRARMRYYSGATLGTWGAWSSPITYVV